jgi:hypothetical protein
VTWIAQGERGEKLVGEDAGRDEVEVYVDLNGDGVLEAITRTSGPGGRTLSLLAGGDLVPFLAAWVPEHGCPC